ncbi:hypothetical protein ABFY60_06690 [Lysinibacillus pakistanensis]|uniref:hypothetical protein n=1 Tax=Lysinibacillus pakistanensis TaxID=759811 RepID=UPI003D274184
MKIGTRIIYGAKSKNVVTVLHRMEGDIVERSNESLKYIDIPFDDFDPSMHFISGIDEQGSTIIAIVPNYETEEQQRIRELEDTLLLQTDSEIGGLL